MLLEIPFHLFKIDNSGFITEEELYNVMVKFRQKTTREEVRKMIKVVDKDKNGKISLDGTYKQFKIIL